MFYSIIVTYHPDVNHLKAMITELNQANVGVIVFDNTPDSDMVIRENESFTSYISEFQNVSVLGDGSNQGLSLAFNKSITYIRKSITAVEGIIFFDQDSTVNSNTLKSLFNEYKFCVNQGYPVGVLGAMPIDVEGKSYWVRKAKNINSLVNSDRFFQADFVISSFSLVPMSTFEKVGLFDEKLFIDLVDSEFSFRCSKNGLLNLVLKNVTFTHVIGDKRGSFLGRTFAISSPIRNYYQARNLILVGRDYGWYFYIARKVARRFFQVILSSISSGDFFKRISYFYRGVKDGILYRGGQIKD